jgi:hypothetical protein
MTDLAARNKRRTISSNNYVYYEQKQLMTQSVFMDMMTIAIYVYVRRR